MSIGTLAPRRFVNVRNIVTMVAALCCGAGAALTAVGAAGDTKLLVLLPAIICAGVIVTLIAMTRFAAYVFLMLLIRASLDATKLTAGDTVARLLTPSTVVAVLFIVAAGLWLIGQYRTLGRLPGSGLRTALVVLLCASALSIVHATKLVPSAADVLRLLAIVLMFVVLEQLMADRRRMKQALLAIFLSAIFPLLYAAMGYATGNPAVEDKGGITRLTATFVQSNAFAGYLMLIVIVGVAIFPHVQGKLRLGLALLLGTCGIALVLTYTLAALVGAFVGLVIVALKQSKRLLIVLAVAVVLALAVASPLSSRLSTITGQGSSASAGQGESSLAWRLGYWTEIIPLADQSPLTGIGYGMTGYITQQGKQPHNDYLRAYVETGLIGLVAYLIFIWMLVRTGIRAARAAPRGTLDYGVAVGYLGCAVAMALVSVVSNKVDGVAQLWYLVAFAAAASSITRRANTLPAPHEPTPQGEPQSLEAGQASRAE